MANINLLYSSIFFGTILLFFCCKYNSNKLLVNLTIIGVLTSILNHMCQDELLQSIDRITMVIGVFIILYISIKENKILPIIGILLTIFLYFLSKYTENDLYHFYAHILITIVIILLLDKNH